MTMRKSLHFVVAAFLFLSLTMSAFGEATSASSGVININTADSTQISYLPRVGIKAAQRVVDYRKEHGNFQKTTDLMQVKGFGEKSFNRLSQYLTVSGSTTVSSKIQGPRKPRTARASKSHRQPATAAK